MDDGQQQLCGQEKQIHAQENCRDRLLDRDLATGEWPCGQQGAVRPLCGAKTCHFGPGPPSEPRGDSGAGPLGPGHPAASHRDPRGRRAAVQAGSEQGPGRSAALGARPASVSSIPGRGPRGHTLGDMPTHGGGSPEANPPLPPPRDHEEMVFAAAGAGPSVSDPHAPTNLLRAASAPHTPTPADP